MQVLFIVLGAAAYGLIAILTYWYFIATAEMDPHDAEPSVVDEVKVANRSACDAKAARVRRHSGRAGVGSHRHHGKHHSRRIRKAS